MVSIQSLRPRRMRLIRRSRLVRLMLVVTSLGLTAMVFYQLCSDHLAKSLDLPLSASAEAPVEPALPALDLLPKRRIKTDRGLIYDKRGLLKGWQAMLDGQTGERRDGIRAETTQEIEAKHPIEQMIASGLDRWNQFLSRQSKTLSQAVAEYERRSGRPPPKGFDQWFAFCQDNDVKIIDDYDQINRDIEPFFALSPELFRKRVRSLNETAHTYEINLSPHNSSSVSGARGATLRPKQLFSLLEPIAQFLPVDVQLFGSDHDMGSWLLGDDQHKAALQAIEAGRFLEESELTKFERIVGRVAVQGLVSACPDDSPAWRMRVAEMNGEDQDTEEETEPSFVYDPRPGYDFCYTPQNLRLHGALSFDNARYTELRPIFQWSKFAKNPEFLTTPLQAYDNVTSAAAKEKTMSWHEKTLERLFWRGSSTGDVYSKTKKRNGNWRRSHRPRLHLLAQNGIGTAKVVVERGEGWVTETWGKEQLNEAYLDLGLTGKPHQCKMEDGTCAEMESEIVFLDRVRPEESNKYKYVLDVDGNGWSSRFNRLLMSGSVVLKTTIYPEWNTDWLIPWVHYVIDYSDLYNIMSFFIGPPDALGSGRDDLARDIADRARSFGETHWRWEDMQAYMFRLLLEYTRLMADDRDSWIYTDEDES